MRKNWILFLGVFVLLFALLAVRGIYRCKGSPDDIPGVYRGFHFGGTEVLNIRTDGTFSQTFTVGSTVYSNSGRWRIGGSRISFTPFIYLVHDAEFRPRTTGVFTCDWEWNWGKTLYFGEDGNYFVSK